MGNICATAPKADQGSVTKGDKKNIVSPQLASTYSSENSLHEEIFDYFSSKTTLVDQSLVTRVEKEGPRTRNANDSLKGQNV